MQGLLQFTLDLFDTAELPSPAVPAVPVATISPAQPAQPPRRAGPDLPAIPLGEAITPARFVHPRATREARIGDARVAYELTRGKRRTIGFVVGAEGLSVRAPRWVALRDVDAAVQEKADWIVRKLVETQQRHAQVEAARIEWRDGVSFPFLGEPLVVQLDPRHGFDGVGAVLDDALPVAPGEVVPPRVLRIALSQNANAAQIRDAVQAWLARQARRIFQERLDHFAPLLGVRWKKLSLSNATTRWGSASSDGAIRLHWRLVHFRLQVIDYVVAHELSHLRVMDHSPRFWETVESVLPDYGTLRRQLKDEPIPRW